MIVIVSMYEEYENHYEPNNSEAAHYMKSDDWACFKQKSTFEVLKVLKVMKATYFFVT